MGRYTAMLFETVQEAQKGSEEAKLELVERFQPTIRANARKLNREDGKEEMTLAFLEILESMNLEKLRSREDGVIVAYFKNALRHAYCHKVEESIKQPSVAFSIDNTEEQEREAVLAQDGWNTAGKDRYFFTLFEGCSELTEKEKEVLTLIYYAGYSATEIAAAWGTSKQNVNQIKRRGLVWGDRIFEKCGIRRDEGGDGGKTLEIRGKRRLSARDGGANYQQS